MKLVYVNRELVIVVLRLLIQTMILTLNVPLLAV